MKLDQWLGYIATFIFVAMYIPQIVTTVRTRSVKNVSLLMFVFGFVGNIIALWYAILIDQIPLVIKYVASLLLIGLYIFVYFRARQGDKNDSDI